MKITVIVPVYNAVTYLRRCLDSVMAQTDADYEAILIDDGSTDGSGEVCDEYAAKEPRFEVLHKENGGVSTARNLGLDRVQGEYVMFVDADDWLEPDALAVAAEMMSRSQTDIVCMGFIKDDDTVAQEPYHEEIEGKIQVRRWICELTQGQAIASKHGVNLYAPWAKLYRMDIIERHHLRFDSELKVAQDFWFNLCYFIDCKHITLYNAVIYHYATTEGSLVRHYSDIRLRDGIVFMDRLQNYWQRQMGGDEKFREAVHHQLLLTVNIALNTYFDHPANMDGFWQKWRELNWYLQEPIIMRWREELTWKDGKNARELKDIVLLKLQLYWLRLLTVPAKRYVKKMTKGLK